MAKTVSKYNGYRLNHPDFQDVYKTTYIKGIIVDIFDNDVASVNTAKHGVVDLPVFYHCEKSAELRSNGALKNGADAFETDDEVIVFCYEGIPKLVVGFIDYPHPCIPHGFIFAHGDAYDELTLTDVSGNFKVGETTVCDDGGHGTVLSWNANKNVLIQDATKCWQGRIRGQSSGAIGYISQCRSPYWHWLLKELPDYSETTKGNQPKAPAQNEICDLKSCSESGFSCGRWWSKTYEDITATAFLWQTSEMIYPIWSVAVSYRGKLIPFKIGSIEYNYWPQTGCQRYILETDTDYRVAHVGFDVWEENNEYKIGIMGDYEQQSNVWKYDSETKKIIQDGIYGSNFRNWWAEQRTGLLWQNLETAEKHFRLVGYDGLGQKAYWCWFDTNAYYEENLKGYNNITKHLLGNWPTDDDGLIQNAIWNPTERKVYFFWKSGEETGDTSKVVYGAEAAIGTVRTTGGQLIFNYTEGGGFQGPYFGGSEVTPLGPESIDGGCSSWGTLTGYVIGATNINFNSTTDKTYLGGEEFKVNHGNCGITNKVTYDRGRTTYHTDCVSITIVGSWNKYGDQEAKTTMCYTNTRDDECGPTSYKDYNLSYWMFNPGNSLSAVLTKHPRKVENNQCVPDTITSVTVGDKAIADVSAGYAFPWDNWEAILLKGTAKNHTITNHVAYIKNGLWVKPLGKTFQGAHGFYQKR